MAAFGGQLFVFGGDGGGGAVTTTVFVYDPDPSSETWATKPNDIPVAMNGARAAVIDDRIYLVGGLGGGPGTNELHIYDPSTDMWGTGASMPVGVSSASVGVIGGKLYVVGGLVFTDTGSVGTSTGTYEYDPELDLWTQRTSTPISRRSAAFGVVDNKLYVAGGLELGVGFSDKLTVYTPPEPSDTTPPVLNLPNFVDAETTSAEGAVVSYMASALDDVDGTVTPDCEPASGTTFPLGATIVTCTATDSSDNTSTDTFIVTVELLSPLEQSELIIDEIGDLVDASALNGGQGNSLVTKLEGVLKQLDSGKIKTAMNRLQAMLNQLDSFLDTGVLTAAEPQVLTDAVEAIIATIESA